MYAKPAGSSFEYHNDPDKTAHAHRDGFFTVGDAGLPRRRRLPLPHRPQERHGDLRRRQHLPARDRGVPVPQPRRRRLRGARRCPTPSGARCSTRWCSRRRRLGARRGRRGRMGARPPRRLQAAARRRARRRAAARPERQGPQAEAPRGVRRRATRPDGAAHGRAVERDLQGSTTTRPPLRARRDRGSSPSTTSRSQALRAGARRGRGRARARAGGRRARPDRAGSG